MYNTRAVLIFAALAAGAQAAVIVDDVPAITLPPPPAPKVLTAAEPSTVQVHHDAVVPADIKSVINRQVNQVLHHLNGQSIGQVVAVQRGDSSKPQSPSPSGTVLQHIGVGVSVRQQPTAALAGHAAAVTPSAQMDAAKVQRVQQRVKLVMQQAEAHIPKVLQHKRQQLEQQQQQH